MSDNVNRLKLQQLNKERDLLTRQIEAVADELTLTTDVRQRALLDINLERLYRDLSLKDVEIKKLEAVLGNTPDKKIPVTEHQLGRISRYETSAQWNRRPAEEVFPYLLDRSEQEESLLQAVVTHKRETSTRPFVCIVHGDELECHMLYLKRLKVRSLPEILSAWHPLEVENTPIEQFDMQLPLNKKTESEYERSLWHSLRAATHGSRPVPEEEIINFVASHKLSVIIRCSLLTEDLRRDSLRSIDWFFKFWERWPEISNLLFLIAITFKYERNSSWKRHPFKNFSRRRLNQHIRQYLNQLDFSEYRNISGTVLPELAAIRRSDAEALIQHEQVGPYSDLDDQDIRMLYSDQTLCTPDGCIPMETLLDRLIGICNERRRRNPRRL